MREITREFHEQIVLISLKLTHILLVRFHWIGLRFSCDIILQKLG